MVTNEIQKDIANAGAYDTTNVIIEDLGNQLFTILVDESLDVSTKEQMSLFLCYMGKNGILTEQFLGIMHVIEISPLLLKVTIFEALFSKHGLSLSRVRGHGYDEASNMQGELNGLKTLIMKENGSAYYVHCFAHQLQLTLVIVAKNHIDVALLFNVVTNIVNVVGASYKWRDMLREKQATKVIESLSNGDIQSGRGMNQETALKRAGDTQCGSHYGTLLSLLVMFSLVIDVLEIVEEDGLYPDQRA